MPNTEPAIQNETDVEFVHRKGRQARKTHVYVMGSITKDRAGEALAEMGMMAEAGAVGFTDDGRGVQDPAVMRQAIKYAAMFDTVVAQHCQDNSYGGGGVMNSGYSSTILGLPGMDVLGEEAMLWRDIQLIKGANVHYHAQHLSTAGAVELIRQAKAPPLVLHHVWRGSRAWTSGTPSRRCCLTPVASHPRKRRADRPCPCAP